jgi:hypothetical protein
MPSDIAKQGAEMSRFQGLFSNVDPHDLQPGQAMVQVNAISDKAGELMTRDGLIELQFDLLV